jgi:hypothetical protein
LSILDDYIDHIINSNNESLLVRIYGIFTIESSYFSNLDVILMQNVPSNFNMANVPLYTFDIKGCSYKRKNALKKGKTLKCMNFKEINSS